MNKIFLPISAVLAFGLFACGEDTSSSSAVGTSDASLYNHSVSVDKANQILYFTETKTGICLLDDHKITWNSKPLAQNFAYKYEIKGDTLFMFPRSLDNDHTESNGYVLTGSSKDIYGTWTLENCSVYKEDGDREVTCYDLENYGFTQTMKISSSDIVTNFIFNSDYNFAYSEFMHDVLKILEGEKDIDNMMGSDLFYSNDKYIEEFKDNHAEDFTVKNNKKAVFSYGKQNFEFSVDTSYLGIPAMAATIHVVSDSDSCSYNYEEKAMTKKLCSDKYSKGFITDTYEDADNEEHEIASSYLDDNFEGFAKCLRKLIKEPVKEESSESEDSATQEKAAAKAMANTKLVYHRQTLPF